jgi:hypothetical protein
LYGKATWPKPLVFPKPNF